MLDPLKDLTPQQTLFLVTLISLGGGPQSAARAAVDAGYTDNDQEAERIARVLLKSPKIIAALRAALWYTLHTSLQRICEALLREYCAGRPLPRQRRHDKQDSAPD